MTMELMKYRLRARRHRIIVLQRLVRAIRRRADRTPRSLRKIAPVRFPPGIYVRLHTPFSA